METRSKNGVILIGVLLVCITGIIMAFVLKNAGSSSDPAVLAKELREAYIAEYGVEPTVSVSVKGVSEEQAEAITKDLADKLSGESSAEDDRHLAVDLENEIIFSAILSE